VAWTAFMLADSLPYWPIDPWLSIYPWFNFQIDLLRSFPVVFPATVLWGASHSQLWLGRGEIPPACPESPTLQIPAARSFGALIFSIFLIPSIRTRHSQQLLIGISVFAGVVLLMRWQLIVLSAAAAALFVWGVPYIPL